MFKLDLEKAEELEIKLPTSVGSQKKQDNSRKTSTSALLTMLKTLTVWITTNCGKFLNRWEYQTNLPASEKSVCRSRNERWNWTWEGRDSCLGSCSVGREGGAAGASWSKCPGLRRPTEPSTCRRLRRQTIHQEFCIQGTEVCYRR